MNSVLGPWLFVESSLSRLTPIIEVALVVTTALVVVGRACRATLFLVVFPVATCLIGLLGPGPPPVLAVRVPINAVGPAGIPPCPPPARRGPEHCPSTPPPTPSLRYILYISMTHFSMRIQRCGFYLNPIKTDRDLAQTSGELAEPAGCPAGSPLPTATSLPNLLNTPFQVLRIRWR